MHFNNRYFHYNSSTIQGRKTTQKEKVHEKEGGIYSPGKQKQ